MLTLSTGYTTAVGSSATSPAFLVQIEFPYVSPTVLAYTARYTSGAAIQWNGLDWANTPVNVTGLSSDLSANNSGQLTISIKSTNPADLMGLALSSVRGFTDRRIKIWTYDKTRVSAGVLPVDDVVLIFDGIGSNTQITSTNIVISLVSGRMKALSAPRVRINKDSGFNHLQPKYTRITWGTETFILE